ncbi:hypothetical protein G4B88_020004 [Cannabis sativa]|uniref:Uncharacterized protein n=1 Tax=Cannabis sativa TaxID=3483 RepID=A0A7J6FD97_CANSA|nr:hypothetical protein G4B88_020004 [Cannabis sativa]
MGKKWKDEEENQRIVKETTMVPNRTNEVIITVFIEKPWPWPHKRAGAKSKMIFPPNQQKTKTRSFDRRAQLLAYAQQLRKSDSEQLQRPKNGSKPKYKVNERSGRIAENKNPKAISAISARGKSQRNFERVL